MKATSKPIAVILIRSGSRGLVDKNIKPLAGKPLVFYTIEVALASKLFSDIWVSSDSLAYLDSVVKLIQRFVVSIDRKNWPYQQPLA